MAEQFGRWQKGSVSHGTWLRMWAQSTASFGSLSLLLPPFEGGLRLCDLQQKIHTFLGFLPIGPTIKRAASLYSN